MEYALVIINHQNVFWMKLDCIYNTTQRECNIRLQRSQINVLSLFHLNSTHFPLVHFRIQPLIYKQTFTNTTRSGAALKSHILNTVTVKSVFVQFFSNIRNTVNCLNIAVGLICFTIKLKRCTIHTFWNSIFYRGTNLNSCQLSICKSHTIMEYQIIISVLMQNVKNLIAFLNLIILLIAILKCHINDPVSIVFFVLVERKLFTRTYLSKHFLHLNKIKTVIQCVDKPSKIQNSCLISEPKSDWFSIFIDLLIDTIIRYENVLSIKGRYSHPILKHLITPFKTITSRLLAVQDKRTQQY